jgi:hypothetical protein
MYDMSWHRYYALMPLGYIGLLKIGHAGLNWRQWHLEERLRPLAILVFGFCFYLMATRLLRPLIFGQPSRLFWLVAGLMVLGSLLYWLILRWRLKAALAVLGLTALLLVPVNASYAWRYFFDVTHTLREASQELGRKIGQARTPGFYELSLYNRTEGQYIGNFRGQVKPDGFTWEGKRVDSLYQAVDEARPRSLGARLMWMLDSHYPGFLKSWELPPNYRQLYDSDWLLYPSDRLSPRYLVIGASGPEVYVQKEVYEFYLSLSKTAPATTGEEVTVAMPRQQIEESLASGRQEPGRDSYRIRLLRLDPTRRIPGGLGK